MADELWMVVGLGNPGREYGESRHNVGFMVAEVLSSEGSFGWQHSSRFQGRFARGSLAGRPTVLVQPLTFMNLSGRCVGPLARFFRVPPERMVVVHDDVDLEVGRLKIKAGGGDGGHKGVRSLVEHLGSGGFFRVRCGVGRPAVGDVVDYVLGPFRPAERQSAQEMVQRASEAVVCLMDHGLKETANRFHRR